MLQTDTDDVEEEPLLPPPDQGGAAWREDAEIAMRREGQALSESASGALFLEIGPEGHLRSSSELEATLGLPPDGLSDLTAFLARIHPAHRGSFETRLEQHRQAPNAQGFLFECALADPNRGWRYVQCKAASSADGQGAARRTVLAFWDAEALRRAQERAEVAEARVEMLERELRALRAPPAPPITRTDPSLGHQALLSADAAGARERFQAARAIVSKLRSGLKSLDDLRSPRGAERMPLADVRRQLESCAPTSRLSEGNPSTEAATGPVEGILEEMALVSLNAQLEALRLGSAGTGLAAVAAQLKQLAKAARGAVNDLSDALRPSTERLARYDREVPEAVEALRELEGAPEGPSSTGAWAQLRAAVAELDRLTSSCSARD